MASQHVVEKVLYVGMNPASCAFCVQENLCHAVIHFPPCLLADVDESIFLFIIPEWVEGANEHDAGIGKTAVRKSRLKHIQVDEVAVVANPLFEVIG